jgi:hypothetical protein
MPRYVLSFRVDPADASNQDAFRRDLYHRFGLKLFSVAWAQIELPGWPRLRELTSALEDLQRRGVARPGSGVLVETLDAGEIDRCEWFLLRRERDVDYDVDPYPTIRADRVPPGRHILDDARFVSERFRSAVEAAQLSGIEFLWVEDLGKHRAVQWYVPIAHHCLGRGHDHPWFDRARAHSAGIRAALPAYDRVAQGISQFDGTKLKPGWTTGDPDADRLLSMFPTDSVLGLMIQMLRRFDRDALPAADFAYDWDWDLESDERPRLRRLAVSARARAALLEAGVVTAEEIEPVLTLDPSAIGRVEFAGECPPPVYTPSELAQLRNEEQSRSAVFRRRVKPERRPTMARSLAGLRAAKKARPDQFRKFARPPRIARAAAELGIVFPADWIDVLKVTDGGDFGHGGTDCQIVPLDDLAAFHRAIVENGQTTEDDYPDGYLNVGVAATGDYYALDLNTERSARDGAVVLFSHETLRIERRWESIAAFLDSILE